MYIRTTCVVYLDDDLCFASPYADDFVLYTRVSERLKLHIWTICVSLQNIRTICAIYLDDLSYISGRFVFHFNTTIMFVLLMNWVLDGLTRHAMVCSDTTWTLYQHWHSNCRDISWDFRGHFEWRNLVQSCSPKPSIALQTLKKTKSNFAFSAVPADGYALLGAKTPTSKVMTASRISTGPTFEGFKLN